MLDFRLDLADQDVPFIDHLLELLCLGPLSLPVFLECHNDFVQLAFKAAKKILLLHSCHLLIRETHLLRGDSGLVSFQKLGDNLSVVSSVAFF